MKKEMVFPQVLLFIAFIFGLILPASVMAQEQVKPMVAAGSVHTVGLKADGTVVAVGQNSYGQCNVNSWRDVVQVAAGYGHTVGLKSDGTVVAAGQNSDGECNVGNWTDITQVAAGGGYTAGLESDGTVVTVGYNQYGQCNVSGWTDIIQVTAGHILHTVGLKHDRTVVAVGADGDTIAAILRVPAANITAGWLDVGNWTDIIQVSAGDMHTAGLESDGTVVAVGTNSDGQCNVSNWTDIVQVAAGFKHTIGLKSNGTLVATGDNNYGQCDVSGWTDIAWVATGSYHTVGLKSDGTVVAAGLESDPVKWNLTKAIDWPLIGGIIAAVVAMGLVILFVHRKRTA